MMNTTYVITGGAGFIGTHLCAYLKEQGATVRIVDLKLRGEEGEGVHDIRHFPYLQEAFSGADVVIHLAALTSVPESIALPAVYAETNLQGSVHVLEAARMCGVKRVVFASSAAVYGNQTMLPHKEDMSKCPESPYAWHKAAVEDMLVMYSALYGMETVSLRFFNVYGEGVDLHNPYAALLGAFVRLLQAKLPLTVTGDGEQTRDFVHVSDIARALTLASLSPSVGAGEVINIGTGIPRTVNDIARLFGGEIVYVPERKELKHSCASVKKAEELLDWKPLVGLEEGIQRFKTFYGV